MWGAVDTERCQWRRDVLGAYGVNPDALEGVSQRSCMVRGLAVMLEEIDI